MTITRFCFRSPRGNRRRSSRLPADPSRFLLRSRRRWTAASPWSKPWRATTTSRRASRAARFCTRSDRRIRRTVRHDGDERRYRECVSRVSERRPPYILTRRDTLIRVPILFFDSINQPRVPSRFGSAASLVVVVGMCSFFKRTSSPSYASAHISPPDVVPRREVVRADGPARAVRVELRRDVVVLDLVQHRREELPGLFQLVVADE